MADQVKPSEKSVMLDLVETLSPAAIVYLRNLCDTLISTDLSPVGIHLARNSVALDGENYVGRLQEHADKMGFPLPVYKFVTKHGQFRCYVRLGATYESGELPFCNTMAVAKKQAAKEALVVLHNHGVLDEEVTAMLGWHQNYDKYVMG